MGGRCFIQLQHDEQTLSELYRDKQDHMECVRPLQLCSHACKTHVSLASYTSVHVNTVPNLLQDEANSAATMNVRPYAGYCIVYHLVVLLEALSRATTIPTLF